ncbi:hypothetical protein [Thalassospira xiamenensis]|uniref:hypothetical protein n=1 Tax=Thalassospira xiamenensis TaxID=220697 RepID=UPI0015F045F8|nr:hypothetical protein [Thalassospira xiamenensis]
MESDISSVKGTLARIEAAPFDHFLEIFKDFFDITKMMALFCLIAALMLAILLLLGT